MSRFAATTTSRRSPRPALAVTPGEAAGVGPDIVLRPEPRTADLILFADPSMLAARAHRLGIPFTAKTWPGHGGAEPALYVQPIACAAPVTPGQLNPANSPYVIECLRQAAQACLRGECDALITGPVHKGVINDAGIAFSGHTEFLAAESTASQVVMMLAAGTLRVALATTHLPLAAVPGAITRPHLEAVLRILHADLMEKFSIAAPRIRVCGLNPHAGESGHLGREEINVIEPVLASLRNEGMRIEGPVPADTAFLPATLAETDAILAMYHDQGLPVLKHHDFAHAINITLGLPFIRTSVDHGTALELAGTGHAEATSLEAAIDFAVNLVIKQNQVATGSTGKS
ncbi:MAG: 4-hydroxythreonine-4-phosphate dehydrogenase PdxA [Gammaproteobacteria bacterium]|nr:4-hydroxythreonine-4-phosphate dehydrogenase PdxA [Gammaproteobacteria bacterium]